ncbi:hypothetical protein ABWJ92_38240 [Streptomyces sp. NPDC000609]|uniref:hypothetical protein n=1 Tax=Streptomyces sp. NPDC000609 TaxID=3160957 RepID=UPI003391DE8F
MPQSGAPVGDPDVRAAIGPVTGQGLAHHLPDPLETLRVEVAQEPVDDVTSFRGQGRPARLQRGDRVLLQDVRDLSERHLGNRRPVQTRG